MSYIGGKARASFILEVLNDPLFDGLPYYECMVGMAHVLRRVRNKRSYYACDINPLVVRLLKAIQEGERLPHISKREYQQLKRQTGVVNLRRAVAAFQYSFNGREFGGYTATYTRPDGRVDDIIASRRRYYDKLRASPSFQRARLEVRDYRTLWPRGAVIYLDPPYAGTTGYGRPFHTDEFWSIVRTWSAHNYVFVSEYSAPRGFVAIASAHKQMTLAGGDHQASRTERLFVHKSVLARIRALRRQRHARSR